MEDNKNILNQLNRTEKPEVPNNYFEEFSQKIVSRVNNSSFLEQFPKTTKPNVPDDFFNQFSENMVRKIEKPTKKGKIIPFVIGLVAVAAVLVLLFNVVNNSGANSNIEQSLADVKNEDTLKKELISPIQSAKTDQIAMIDTDVGKNEISIVSMFSETDINNEDLLFNEFEEELDEFYYDF